MSKYHEYAGNIHMHTVYSDGWGTHDDLVQAARAAKLDFLIATDHNVLALHEQGWRDGVLLLIGVEVNDVNLRPTGNHCLCLNVSDDPTPYASDPQALVNHVRAQGGMTFFAHPVERQARLIADTFPWRAWHVQGFTGIEIWNYMSEFRTYLNSVPAILDLTLRPQRWTTGPYPETLSKWDELLAQRQEAVVILGGSDAHARVFGRKPFGIRFLPYVVNFRAVNTHILAREPLTHELEHDKQQVYQALAAGHCWVGYDRIADTRDFNFWASQGQGETAGIMGDTLPRRQYTLCATLPDRATLRLVKDGQVVLNIEGNHLEYAIGEPGIYRLEAWRNAWGKLRGWIFSNPLYVK